VIAAPDYGDGGPFSNLPGSAAEAKDLHARYRAAQVLISKRATKEALLQADSPRFLHLATHACFGAKCLVNALPARPSTVTDRGLVVDDLAATPLPPDVAASIDSLDLAELAFAGANERPQEGIVTARQLAGMNLWGTRLVVLSACESGLGDVSDGEGVYGLRRALVIAGAEAQVVTLWNVDDSAAPQLMRAYYDELDAGHGRSEALRRAQLSMFHSKTYANPYYWAPFLPAGDWRPLDVK
jgi:CHAT domain-containing protein